MSQTIQEITLSAMSNALYVQFMSDVDNQIKRVTPEALKIKKCYQTFSDARATLDSVFITQQKDNRSVSLASQDSVRDRIYRCISGHAKADLFSSNPDKQAKAQILLNKLDAAGYLPTMGNNEESARMDDLGKDLEVSPMAEIVEALGLTDELKAMIAANDAFIALSRERTEDKKNVQLATKEARRVLDPAYRDMISVVNSQITIHALMDEDSSGGGEDDRPVIESVSVSRALSPLEDFALSINAIIREYKTKTAQSGSSKKKEEDDRPVIE